MDATGHKSTFPNFQVAKSRFRRGDVSGDGRLDYSELSGKPRLGYIHRVVGDSIDFYCVRM